MNTTTIRAAIREALADPVGGIYTDAAIDAAAASAYTECATAHPAVIAATITVAAGDTTLVLPAGVITVRQVRPTYGTATPGTAADTAYQHHTGAQLFWHQDTDATIQLSRPVHSTEAGSWRLLYTTVTPIPANNAASWALAEPLAPAVIALAAGSLLRARAYTLQRRGGKADFTTSAQADQLLREARNLIDHFDRKARMS